MIPCSGPIPKLGSIIPVLGSIKPVGLPASLDSRILLGLGSIPGLALYFLASVIFSVSGSRINFFSPRATSVGVV